MGYTPANLTKKAAAVLSNLLRFHTSATYTTVFFHLRGLQNCLPTGIERQTAKNRHQVNFCPNSAAVAALISRELRRRGLLA